MAKESAVFFSLLKSGLWGKGNLDICIDGTSDWHYIYQLAQEQSVLGLVLAGLEHSEFKPPKELLLRIPADTRSVIPVIPVHSGCEIFN